LGKLRRWALAAIWGLHPLLTESVVNIVGAPTCWQPRRVSRLVVLREKRQRRRAASCGIGWAGLAAAQAIGLFSKENAVVLPGIMLLHDLIWRDPRRGDADPAYAAVALPFAAYFYLRQRSLHTHMLIDLR